MSRMYTLSLIVIVIVLLFHFGGLLSGSPSGTAYVLEHLGVLNPDKFDQSSFWTTLGLITTLGVAGIIAGLYITRSFEASLFFGVGIYFTAILIGMGIDLVLIYNQLRVLSEMLAVLIVGPLFFMWGISVYDWINRSG